MFLSQKKEIIIRLLAEYKYLSVSHLLNLGVTESVQVCRRELRELRTKFKLTEKMTVASISGSLKKRIESKIIRQEDIHFLTPRGAKFLEEEAQISKDELRYPKRVKLSLSNDYFHRISSISIHISYNKWIEKNDFDHYDTLLYYDKRRKFKKVKTTIESRIKLKDNTTKTPDLVMGYKDKKGNGRVFIVEVYNGARPQYVLDETKEMIRALQESTELSERIGIKKTPRILITCETEQRMERAMDRIREDSFFNFKQVDEILLFNIDKNVWKDFGSNWINLSGEVIDLEKI